MIKIYFSTFDYTPIKERVNFNTKVNLIKLPWAAALFGCLCLSLHQLLDALVGEIYEIDFVVEISHQINHMGLERVFC